MKNYRLYGNKPYKVAVIHGGPGALGSVGSLAKELSNNRGVIEPLQTKNTIDELVKELHNVLDTNTKEKITLIGHSWGAWLIYIFASIYPEMVDKIILVGSGPFESSYAKSIMATRLSRLSNEETIELNRLFDMYNCNKSVMNEIGKIIEKSDTYNKRDIDDYYLPSDGKAFDTIWPEAAELRKTGKLLEYGLNIKCNIVVIHGDYDPHPFEGIKIPLNKIHDNIEYYLLKNCGHSPWKEKESYQEFYEILEKHI